MTLSGDLNYSPNLEWPKLLITQVTISRILFIGEPDPALTKIAVDGGFEAKHYTPQRHSRLPRGTTIFRNREGQWIVVFSALGGISNLESIPDGRLDSLEDAHPLVSLSEAFGTFWEAGAPMSGSAQYQIGDSVQILSDNTVGKVDRVQIIAGEPRYAVLTNRGILNVFEAELERLESMPGDPTTWISQRPSNAETIALTITATKLRDPLTDVIYSFQTSRTLFRPYQFRPVLKMLTGTNQRLLIADEVGLGKTIEAGLIWSELEFRSPMDSVLVVCPSALKRKWQSEMKNRFDRDLKDLSTNALDEWLLTQEKGHPDRITAVASLEGLRISKHLERMVELAPRFDLIIVDEAHYLRNAGNLSNQLGRHLSDWADSLLFLSATPLNLGTDDLFNLLSLLDEAQFFDKSVFQAQIEPNAYFNEIAGKLAQLGIVPKDLISILKKVEETAMGKSLINRSSYTRLLEVLQKDSLSLRDVSEAKHHLAELNSLASVFTRTRKADTPEKRAIREPISMMVNWTEQERQIYDSIHSFLINRAFSQGKMPGFQIQNPLRQAASCLPGVIELLKDEKYGLRDQEDDPLEDTSEYDDESEDELTVEHLINTLGILPTLTVDSKYEEFKKALIQARDLGSNQALVFSFFTRTILYLEKRLKRDGFSVQIMYGKTPQDKRQQVMQDFRHGTFDILLCSEVGSEGLDFEFCNVLVNYDLPWNPMRVEQRIGRLDRFGQQSEKIFIFNIRIPGTIEDDIFMRLFDRIGVFQDSIGPLEPILREDLRLITSQLLNPRLTQKQRDTEIQRIGVALEKKKTDLEDLKAHQNLVAGIDAFLIEGFDEHTPGRGRFLGKEEIIRVVEKYVIKLGGALSQKDSNHWLIIGSSEIASKLRDQIKISNSGTTMGIAAMSRELDGRAPGLIVTFDPETAAREGIELISVRNPLLKCVKNDLVQNENLWSRFGSVHLPGLTINDAFLIGIHLARAQGIRPSLALWTTAFDLNAKQIVEGPGEILLQSLAANTFTDSHSSFAIEDLRGANAIIERFVAEKQAKERNRLAQDNRAIAEEQAIAKRLSLQNKIDSTRSALEKVTRDNRTARVITMNQSRLRNLTQELTIIENSKADSKSSLSVEAIAYILVTA